MCGIIGVLPRRPSGAPPDLPGLLDEIEAVAADASADLAAATARLEAANTQLLGPLGVQALLAGDGAARLEASTRAFDALIAERERALDAGEADAADLERANAELLALKDAVWALGHDRVTTARGVADLLGPDAAAASVPVLTAYWAMEVALSALDRLEVRGRDSAGLHVLVAHPGAVPALDGRATDPLFGSLAVRQADGALSFVYKVAEEIGELGDNTAALRGGIRADASLRAALDGPDAQATVLGHTRWASVGVISEANAHPLNSESVPGAEPYVVAAINGDVDNYRELQAADGLSFAPEITTDAKVVPAMVARRLAAGDALDAAFCATVSRCEGSAAIAASAAGAPDRLHLAMRGSGQSLYVGLAKDAFVVASEPYGVVQETARYIPMEGEGTGRGAGQVIVLDRAHAGALEGVRRLAYDGSAKPVGEDSVKVAEITARDIDRAGFPHFLLKEISEAPASFRKTLRGKIRDEQGRLTARLGPDTLPDVILDALRDGRITRVKVIAQGTAAVAGQSVATALATMLEHLPVAPVLATELSGFGLEDDMSDTLVVAVSQSGTTTDTNRTVDLVRARGAAVIAIVNRRNSDLAAKADGVLYTSDGRDVEMSVASTKAFYAQVAAGWILAIALADHLDCGAPSDKARLLAGLRALPEAMEAVLAERDAVAAAARAEAPARRHWAVVGNGPNRVAAEEVRIKLSELCYHAIACDGTEDKKHIDLSSEPLILVCAAGLSGANADDVAKEVAIFGAHKAAPVVVATAGEHERFSGARHTIAVPVVEPELGFVLSAMAGHLFGYEAALAIDAEALPLREAHVAVERAVTEGTDGLAAVLAEPARAFFAALAEGRYNGNLEASTAVRVAALLRYVTGGLPDESYELEFGRKATPEAVLEDLSEALTLAVSELTRPVDAIKHQAKTVTVGISRSEDELLGAPLVQAVLDAGTPDDALSYRGLRTLAELGPLVADVTGFTRYAISGDVTRNATVAVVGRGGVADGLPSRTDSDPRLLGAKRRAAQEREVTVAVGGRDGRHLILIPEVTDGVVTGICLLHVDTHETLPVPVVKRMLSEYRGRYAAIFDAVTETEPTLDDERLADVRLIELFTEPVHVLARYWRDADDVDRREELATTEGRHPH